MDAHAITNARKRSRAVGDFDPKAAYDFKPPEVVRMNPHLPCFKCGDCTCSITHETECLKESSPREGGLSV